MNATIEILSKWTGEALYSCAIATIKEAAVQAVKDGADLRGANLYGADLYGANLRDANLRGVDLYGANLYGADLRGANLRDANLRDANLRGANLRGANLRGANLRGADLYGADLYGADLYGADLYGANLRDANLCDADLYGANLYGADLRGANLCDANLRGVDLYGANLRGADLRGANLRDAKNIPLLIGAQISIVPEHGPFFGWKNCRNNVIIKVAIGANARRSSATGRKCRAEYVKVLEVIGGAEGVSHYDPLIVYRKGEIVKCDKWNDDRWVECGGGIHFFLTRIEAENY